MTDKYIENTKKIVKESKIPDPAATFPDCPI
jgi:hypothetical protein